MSDTQHTPGPWIFDYDRWGKESPIYAPNSSDSLLCEPIARIPHDDMCCGAEVEVWSNAQLIIAASELLVGLEWALEMLHDLDDAEMVYFERALSAISKAKAKWDPDIEK